MTFIFNFIGLTKGTDSQITVFIQYKKIDCLLHKLHEKIKLHEFASCSGPGCCYINLNFGPKLSLTKGLKNSKLFTGESSDTKYASPAWKKRCSDCTNTLYNRTFYNCVLSALGPLNRSEAGRDLVLLKTFLLFMCQSWYSHASEPVNMIIHI